MERMRNRLWWLDEDGITAYINQILEEALTRDEKKARQLKHPESGRELHKPAGMPYPPREGKLRTGRPKKQ